MGGKLSLILLALLGVCIWKGSAQSTLLSTSFYANSCPNVEAIVKNVVDQKFSQTFVTVLATLRLFFHDCFVEGCDTSVVIQSTGSNQAEKDFQDKLSLAGDGFDTTIKAKQAVQNACPNTVSCADILAIATKAVIRLGYNVGMSMAWNPPKLTDIRLKSLEKAVTISTVGLLMRLTGVASAFFSVCLLVWCGYEAFVVKYSTGI